MRTRRRRFVAIAVAIVGAVAIAAVPWILRPLAASSIADAVASELPASAEIDVAVELGWFGPIGAIVEARDGDGVELAFRSTTTRGLLGWIVPLTTRDLGTVPIEFSLEGRLEGERGRAWRRWWVARESSSESPPGSPPESASGSEAAPPEPLPRLAIEAVGRIAIAVRDAEEGVDLSIRSETVDLELLADRSLRGVVDMRVGRADEFEAPPGRLAGEWTVAGLLGPNGETTPHTTSGVVVVDGSDVSFSWSGREVTLDALAASAELDPGEGATLGLRFGGAVDDRPALVEADLSWRTPFDDRGSLRGDVVGLGGTGRISGLPLGAFSASLPPKIADLVEGLGTSLEAEWSLPIEGDELRAVATTDRASLEIGARLDREAGRLSDGSMRLDATPTWPPMDDASATADRAVPVRVAASGIEYRDGELEIAEIEAFAARGAAMLVETAGIADTVETLEDAPIELRASSIRWRPVDGVQALEARGRMRSGAILRASSTDGRFTATISGSSLEWFAEPLGRALSLQGEIGVDDGTLRFDERLDGLWTGDAWLPATSLRPHGTASIDGVDPALLLPLLPEPLHAAWARQARGPLDATVSTRVEGDRLEGMMRASGPNLDLRVPLSIDAQRIAIGPAEASLVLSRDAIAALPESWTGGLEFGSDLEAILAADPILLPVDLLAGERPALPAVSATCSVARMPIVAAPGLAGDAAIDVLDLAGRIVRRGNGTITVEGDARLAAANAPSGLGEVRFEFASPTTGDAAGRVEIASFDASAFLPMLAVAKDSVLEDPASVDWIGPLEISISTATGGGLAVSARGAALEASASMRAGDGEGDSAATLDSIELDATVPPIALAALGGEASATTRPTSGLRLAVRGEALSFGGGGVRSGDLAVEFDPIELAIGEADKASQIVIGGHRAAVSVEDAGRAIAIRLGPMRGEGGGAGVGFDGRLSRTVDGGREAWRLDGGGSLREVPTSILDAAVEAGGLLATILGESVGATVTCEGLGAGQGELTAEATFPNGSIRLPRLIVEPEVLRIPTGSEVAGELRFGPGVAELLADLAPMLGSLESLESPVRMSIADAVLPRSGVDRRRLAGDLRLDIGRGRFQPRGVLRRALLAFDDANATGFDGEVAPLSATIREGRLAYRDFEVRFVPFGAGWRNTIDCSGEIDLGSAPVRGAFTMVFPATSLSAYSADIRRIAETRPELLEAVGVPLTLRGPLDGSAPFATSVDFDVGSLIEAGAEILLEEGLRRLFEGLK